MTNGFYILPSFFEAVSKMATKDQGEMWRIIVQYGMTGEVPSNIKKSLEPSFVLIKPIIDSQQKKAEQRRENGRKGGRKASSETKEEPSGNQKEPNSNLTEPNSNLTEPNPNLNASIESVTDKGTRNEDKGQGNKENEIEKENSLSPLPSPLDVAENMPQKESVSPKERIDLFAKVWDVYPRKEGKVAAAVAWNNLQPDSSMADAMIAAIRSKLCSEEWQRENGRYIPHFDKWLSDRRWEDEGTECRPPEREISYSELKAIKELFGG